MVIVRNCLATIFNCPCMVTSLYFIVPSSSVAASKFIFRITSPSIRHTAIKFTTIIRISDKTIFAASNFTSRWSWLTRWNCSCSWLRSRCLYCSCYCRCRIARSSNSCAILFITIYFIEISTTFFSTRIFWMYTDIQVSWEYSTRTTWEFKGGQFFVSLINTTIENSTILFVCMKSFRWTTVRW